MIGVKESIMNGVGVKQYSIIEEANRTYRAEMEDSTIEAYLGSIVRDCFLPNCPKSTLIGVFDGHGGKEVSYRLVSLIPNSILANTKIAKGNIKNMLEKTFLEVFHHHMKLDKTISEEYTGDAGSTATVALITLEEAKRMLYVAHVGDSCAYLFEDHGFQLLTPEHRGNNMEEVKRVEANGGKILNNRLAGVLAVTRAFGDRHLKKMGLTAMPQIRKLEIRLSHKYLIVGSDGLWDFINPKKVLAVIRDEIEAHDIGKRLMKLAIENGSNDNVTIVVLKLN